MKSLSLFLICFGELPLISLHAANLCLLPIGDSLTQADKAGKSYRYPLWTRLVDKQKGGESIATIDFAGSMVNHWLEPIGTVHPQTSYRNEVFPGRHEGHWGWRADEILNGHGTGGSYPGFSSGSGNLKLWMEEYWHSCLPNCVLLHLGTNDILEQQLEYSVIEDLRQIISTLRTKFGAEVRFLVAMPFPCCCKLDGRTTNVGQVIHEWFTGPSSDDGSDFSLKNVHVVDMATDFDNQTMLYDGCHPNSLGESFMASRWLTKIMEVCTTPFTTATPTTTTLHTATTTATSPSSISTTAITTTTTTVTITRIHSRAIATDVSFGGTGRHCAIRLLVLNLLWFHQIM